MTDDEAQLAHRAQALDERERALLEREEALARQAHSQQASPALGAPRENLDRPPPVVAENPHRSLAFLFIFLAALALLGWIVFRGNQRPPEHSAASETFTPPRTRGLDLEIPKPPGPVPGTPAQRLPIPPRDEAADRVREQEQAQALIQARRHAPILVTYAMVPGPRAPGNVGRTPAATGSIPGLAETPNFDRPLPMDAAQFEPLTRASAEPGDPNTRFQRQLARTAAPVSVATQMGNRDFLVLQGKVIDAVAETAINSDLPGQVRALVSYDVYAESGRRVMLPRGTRLIGEYNTALAKGQERLFVIWTRAIRPDGIDIGLLSGGTDPLGRAGLAGEVDTHFWTIFGTSALLSIIGAGAATAGVSPAQDQLNSTALYRAGVAQSFNRSAGQVLDKYLDIKPTIRIANGATLKVFVARDLDFSAALAAREPRDQASIIQ
jgi:type IV secretion system protein VirB10